MTAGAGLIYASDSEPGITRKRAGKGFYYLSDKGIRITDEEVLLRLRTLAIPPAWKDVWIAADENAHLQATGRDEKGRKQYRYHPAWTAERGEAKFQNLVPFAHKLATLREAVDADLRKRGPAREKVIASVVWLLDNALIRIGNEIYSKQNKSYGLTTLRSKHVEIEGSRLRFSFPGKSGKQWELKITDRRLAKALRSVQELPGQNLFQYIDEDGERRPLRSQDVNLYIQEVIGPEFSSKHFRTWGATTQAAFLLSEVERPDTVHMRKRVINQVIDKVARQLNNTRAVCRSSYIHPAVIEAFEAGSLGTTIAEMRKRYRKPLKGLELDESIVLRWLEALS
ncbi:DNA topoisomerase IB [Limoniibacter endophyticus]|uniref:DNA topoisomerase n=1 Tax=Limoniibacter endophyticus TaxID=1565040 RepID=A0A8J3DHY7_9HYPH|nr:DNA topoisomerase IB [Limoniibacter endophyticus]GHC73051.1 DNA topoisomerase [Limoniibacter endophyticus]